MNVLPLGPLQHDLVGYYLTRPNAEQRVAESLERDGELAVSIGLPDGTHEMRVRLAEKAVAG